MTGDSKLNGADIRAKLNHPVVDADGHMIEATFAVLDYLKQVGGADMAAKFEKSIQPGNDHRRRGAVWIGNSGAGTIDRATAMLPRLMYERLDDAGIDFAVVYGTFALGVLGRWDDEMRTALYRAMNMLYADMFKGLEDRLTPVALIPTHTPEEALTELDFAVGELGLKAIAMNGMIRRPHPEIMEMAPELAKFSLSISSPALDVGDTYDPVWQKCVDLGVAPTCHNGFRGYASTHGSPVGLKPEDLDDFGAAGIEKPEDIRDMFANSFYFGSEADDTMTAVGFDPKFNHYDIKLKAILGSDIGHWDVPDMTKVMVEAYEMLDDGFLDESDFRDFVYGNVVGMHTEMNPDFFKGTVVEGEVEAFKAEKTAVAAE